MRLALRKSGRIAWLDSALHIDTWIHHFAGKKTEETQIYSKRDYDVAGRAQVFADWVSDGNAVEVAELLALGAAREELRRLHALMR